MSTRPTFTTSLLLLPLLAIVLQTASLPLKDLQSRQTVCETPFGDEVLTFESCTELQFGLSVYWSFPAGTDTIEVAISKATSDEYIGFSFSQDESMIPNSAVIAFEKQNGTTFASDYRLTSRSSDGVVAGEGGQGLTNVAARVGNGVLTARFTRPLAPSGDDFPSLEPGMPASVIYAVGSAPETGEVLTQHRDRASGTITLVQNELLEATPTAKPEAGGTCIVSFGGEQEEFQACKTLTLGVDIYWRFPEGEDNIEVLVQRITDSEYLGFGFSNGTSMVPNSAVIAYPLDDSTTSQGDYELRARSSDQVVRGDSQELETLDAEFDQGKLSILFSRPLRPTSGDLPVLDPSSGTETNAIWSYGSAPEEGGSLQTHIDRDFGTIDLTQVGSLLAPADDDATATDAPSDEDTDCSLQVGDQVEEFERCQTLELGIVVYWRFPEGGDVIEAAIQKTTEDEYIGFAFSLGTQMVPNSAVIAYPVDGGADSFVSDYALTARNEAGVVAGEGGQGLSALTSNYSDGVLTAFFTRPLAPPASASGQEFPVLEPEGETPMIWCIGPAPASGNVVSQHSERRQGTLDLSGATAVSASSSRLATEFIVHAVLMSTAWLLLVPVGIIFARYMKGMGSWFQVHRGVQVTAIVAGTAGWILALVRASRAFKLHLILGSVASVLGILQVVGGLVRPQAPGEGEEPTSVRKFWYLGHSMLGRIALILALVNIFIGINLAPTRAAGSTVAYSAAVGVYIGVLVIVIVVLEVLKAKKKAA